mgnify:CR=1 FL=1
MHSIRFPVYFLSHGGGPWPWIAQMKDMYAATAREFAALPGRLPAKPKAILVISGHWEEDAFTVSTAAQPPRIKPQATVTIHSRLRMVASRKSGVRR